MEKIFLIKKRLKEIRENKKFSRPKVAKETGISRGTIEWWEMKGSPISEQIISLADYYNVSLDYIACRTDKPEVNK